VLVGAAALVVQWFAYLLITNLRPSWATPFLGPHTTWDDLQRAWWLGTAFFKGFLVALAFVCVWLTLWARQLRRTSTPAAV
jgi:hypothetical protein